MESAKLRATRALVPCVLRALRALVTHAPRDLRAVVPYVLSSLMCLVPYVPSLSHVSRALRAPVLLCLVPYVSSCLTCLVPYVLSRLTCLVPYVLSCRAARASCRTYYFTLNPSIAAGVSSLTYSYACLIAFMSCGSCAFGA